MRLKQILSLCLLFTLSSVFLFCLISGRSSIILSSLPTAMSSYVTHGDTRANIPPTYDTTTDTTTTPYTTTTTIPTTTTSTTTAPTDTTTTSTIPSTTTTVPTTTTYSPTTTTTTTTYPVSTTTYPTSPSTSTSPTTTEETTHPTSTTTTLPTTTGTTTTGTATTIPSTTTTAPITDATTPNTTTSTTTATDATAPAPTTTTTPASVTTTTTPVATTTAPTASAANTATTTTALAATENTDTITPGMLDVSAQITNPLTEDRKLCLELTQKIEKITFVMEGTATVNLTTFSPAAQKYCANLMIGDFADGSYKLTVTATKDGKPVFNTLAININKATSQNVTDQKISELENRCSQAGADSSEECKDFYLNKYSEQIDCRSMDSAECGSTVKGTYIQTIVESAKQYESINNQSEAILDKTMTVGKLENLVNNSSNEDLNLSIPLKEKETEIKIIKSYENIILDKEKGLIQTAPIVVMIDTDGDGVPDDMERRLGTKFNDADTDGDGYKDGEEILKGYDPLGSDKKDTSLSPIERAIMQGQSIEHPKTSGEESASLNIAAVKTIYNADGKQGGYTMTGKADADSVITLYIYSDIPIVTTVTTDEYGNWEYHFAETLEDGDHEVYIAINDETGKVVKKSSPLSFLVREAQAGSNDIPNAPSSEVSDNMINYYLYAAIGLIIIGVSIFLVALLKSRNKNKQTNDKA